MQSPGHPGFSVCGRMGRFGNEHNLNCIISNNSVNVGGGGISVRENSFIEISNTLIENKLFSDNLVNEYIIIDNNDIDDIRSSNNLIISMSLPNFPYLSVKPR